MISLPYRLKPRLLRPQWLSLSYFAPALLAVAAIIIGLIQLDSSEKEQYLASQRALASEELAKVGSTLETNIRGNVNLIYGLVAAVAANPSMSQPQFSALSERIFAVPSQLRNLAAAPDLIVTMVYPEEANRNAIGLDYRKSAQGAAVQTAIERRRLIITGPVDLVQGGAGLIARQPVFSLSNGRFWGMVSAVIDLERLFRDSNVGSERQSLTVAIALRPSPSQVDMVLGDSAIFQQDPVKFRIDLGYDSWYLSAIPKDGWKSLPPDVVTYRAHAIAIAFMIVAPLIWAGVLMKQRHDSIVTLQQREEQLEKLHYRLSLALEASEIGVWEYEPVSDTLLWDRRLRELYSAPPDRASGSFTDWRDSVHPDDLHEAQILFKHCLDENLAYITQFRIVRPDGEIRHVRAHGATYITSTGVQRIVGANWDVTDDVNLQNELRHARARAEEQNDQLRATRRTLEHQSLHDALTGLPNRRFLDQFMEAGRSTDPAHRLAFIHVDLDRFKEVNDTLGHAAGDEVLRQATSRLLHLVGHDEFASRVGGDEYVVVTSGPSVERRSQDLAQAIVKSLSKPIDIGGNKCRIGCSAGIAWQTPAMEEPRQLLVDADIALYEAKKRGRNRMEIFSDELRMATVLRKTVSDEFLTALEHDQIVPFFQPQFDARTLDIVGVEALARWEHPERGIIAPNGFLDIAESLNRAADLDAIMLDKAHFQSCRWQALGLSIPHLSVNISSQRLKDPRLFDRLAGMNITPGSLSFELLESISFDDSDEDLGRAIGRLKALGIDIEIDDFGTGYASIVSLIELGPKRLKIDRKLIAPLAASGPQRHLVASIIEIGKSQDIQITAEGVETTSHIEILRSLGCHVLQGYALAKPMSSEDFVAFVTRWQNGEDRGGALNALRQPPDSRLMRA
jgi:diguanylate cyclase (GGDEF)-like protein